MDEFKEHMIRTNMRLDQHEQQLDRHHQDMMNMNATLNEMVKQLQSIRWLITGGVGTLIVQQMGLFEALKKMIF